MASKRRTRQPGGRQPRGFRSRAQEAAVAILRTADAVRQRLAAAVEPHGLTLQQYNVLRILRGAHPEPLATLDIRERMIERSPGITRFVDQLDELGLLRRERSADDRRVVHCWITERGLELLAGMDAEVDRADDQALAALDEAQLGVLVDLLDRVRADG